jgi:hypothetical protein
MEHMNLLVGLIVGVLTIVGFISGFFKWVWKVIREKIRGSDYAIHLSTKTIAIVPTHLQTLRGGIWVGLQVSLQCRWSENF